MYKNKRIGVALSGGGYRAAAFHIGALKKLYELNILQRIDVLSTISGGSITGAAYCLHEGSFKEFEEKMILALSTKNVIGYTLRSWRFLRVAIPALLLLLASVILPFTGWAYLSLVPLSVLLFLLVRYQFQFLPVSAIIEKAYDDMFFQGAVLSQLCSVPELAIGATNLQTMRPFTFSKRKMEDSAYARYRPPVLFDNTNFPVARAVTASSCVPFAFTPVFIDKLYFKDPDQYDKVVPALVDGGVYDNQGIHKLTQKNSSYACDIVIVSDAGNKLPFHESYNNTFTLLLRTMNAFMARIKHFQMIRNIYENHHRTEVAYQSLGWDINNCIPGFYNHLKDKNVSAQVLNTHRLPQPWIDQPDAHKEEIMAYLETKCRFNEISAKSLSNERLQRIRRISTNLTCLRKEVIKDMIIHAENLTELQIRLYCPTLFES
ncbi:patatin-like phospholipase family protein [Runella aurantiaca]|uniref:PNPLA domain-containing protein n=1 Tax=Runella aurantiaca TaxID=2282308 RepID=A0A369IDG0_9BACT|nr:patatin-like phospholipase family protein [Runella aurantiaca]RDB07809.1 hypothetical protein DVG78_01775 [Runella aurantiaca]